MPRHPRIHIDGVPQHIIQRGNNREPCFLTDLMGSSFPSDRTAKADLR
jgi:putative transposase